MRWAATASATSLLGWSVLMPTSVGPLPRSASTSSQVKRYLRVGLSLSDSHTTEPGAISPIIEPVFGQVAVIEPSVVQPHVGQEALVALDQRAANEGGGEAHGAADVMPADACGASR